MSQPERSASSLKTVIFALGANFGIALIKLGAAVYTGSGSMLAETLHSFADCGNQGLLLIGLRQAKLPPSDLYPLGRGARLPFFSFLVAVLLFSIGGLFSIYEGWHKLQLTEPLRSPFIALIVLAVSIILESLSLAACLKEIGHVRGDRSLWRWFRETRRSELIVVLGEDLAALSGLVLATLFIVVAMLTGNPLFDAIGSIAIGVLLVVTAIGVGLEVSSVLVGESAEPAVRMAIQAHLSAAEGIDEVFHLITLHFGDDLMVAVKARMAPMESTVALCKRINGIEKTVKAAFPQVRWIFFEPDITD